MDRFGYLDGKTHQPTGGVTRSADRQHHTQYKYRRGGAVEKTNSRPFR